MKSWHFLGCLLPALMLAGCAPPMPHLAKPTPLQDLQLGSDLTQKKSSVAAVADWWRPLLNQPEQNIMQLALEKNPDMLAAKARIALALSALREAGAQREPQLQGTGQIGVSRWTKNQFYLPPYAGETSWNNSLKFDFSFHLDLWGKEQEQVKEARLRLQAAEQQRRAARLILENAVLQQLLAIDASAAILQRLQAEQHILQRLEQIEKERQQHGLSDSLLSLASVARLAGLEQEIAAQKAKYDSNRQALATLCGVGVQLPLVLRHYQPNLLQTHWQQPSTVPAEWIAERPDIVAQRMTIKAAAAAVHIARDAYYPNINLVAFAGGLAAAGGLFTFLHPGSLQAGVGPAISLPLFTGGRLRGHFDASQAKYQLARAAYQKSLLQALQQVAFSLRQLQSASQEREILQRRAQALSRSAALQQQRYQAGLSNALPVMTAQLPIIDNQMQQIRLDTYARQNLIKLYAALGGRVIPKTWTGPHSPS